jgi:hypothetical protein
MAGEVRLATANRAARASLALLAVRLGLIRTRVIRTRKWRSADRGTGVEIQIVPPDRGDVPIDPSQSAVDQTEIKSREFAVGAPSQASEANTTA